MALETKDEAKNWLGHEEDWVNYCFKYAEDAYLEDLNSTGYVLGIDQAAFHNQLRDEMQMSVTFLRGKRKSAARIFSTSI